MKIRWIDYKNGRNAQCTVQGSASCSNPGYPVDSALSGCNRFAVCNRSGRRIVQVKRRVIQCGQCANGDVAAGLSSLERDSSGRANCFVGCTRSVSLHHTELDLKIGVSLNQFHLFPASGEIEERFRQ